MEKRIFLAILISLGLLWGWAWLAPKLFPDLMKKPAVLTPAKTGTAATSATTGTASTTTGTASTTTGTASATTGTAVTVNGTTTGTAAATTTSSAPVPAAAMTAGAPAPAPAAAAKVQLTVVETPEYKAVFTNRGAQLISFKLKKYQRKHHPEPEDLVKAREANRPDYPFAIVPADPALHRLNTALYRVTDTTGPNGARVIEYRYSDGHVIATKTFTFANQPYLFGFAVSINPPAPYRIAVGPGIRTLDAEEQDTRVITTGNGIYQSEGKLRIVRREKAPPLQVLPGVEYIGLEDNYFMAALRPQHAGDGILQGVVFNDGKTKARREDLYAGLNAAGDGAVSGEMFLGPKETKILDQYGMSAALQFGWFSLIGRFFLGALIWLNRFTHNYGFGIIVLTILIKIVLYPLQHKSIVSMKKMQKVQPKIEAIKAKYKKAKSDAEQRQKMNVETMALYQKEGINPMAGCLPLVLQLPILWGFYGLLSRAIELRGAPFILWIHDLSDKDPTYVLPVLMTATMFIQTYITPSTGDPAQRKMFLIMPLVFGFLFKDFPSGLVLYWLVQNTLTIIQQSIMNKWWKEHPIEIQKA